MRNHKKISRKSCITSIILCIVLIAGAALLSFFLVPRIPEVSITGIVLKQLEIKSEGIIFEFDVLFLANSSNWLPYYVHDLHFDIYQNATGRKIGIAVKDEVGEILPRNTTEFSVDLILTGNLNSAIVAVEMLAELAKRQAILLKLEGKFNVKYAGIDPEIPLEFYTDVKPL